MFTRSPEALFSRKEKMMQTGKLILLATAAGALFTATTASAGYIDEVNLGALPAGTSTLTLYNGLSSTGVPDASGLVGDGAAINGIVTSSPGPSAFIYEFTVKTVFNVYGEVDGPFINFIDVAIFSGTPASPTGTAVAGQVFCGCGPGEGGFALTTLNETWTFLPFQTNLFQITHANLALSPGSYFLELSNPQLSSWENNPKAPDSGFPVPVNLTVSAKSMNAPEIDPVSAVTALTLLAGSLLVFRGRREMTVS
jgi:hypothetical protein